ncbi:MAG TPA: tetratricopeptide repeat protein, partial [Bdellovibrio sp.]|nr:tetratricopeptide repeat protein [Bdellovibrio sp.]
MRKLLLLLIVASFGASAMSEAQTRQKKSASPTTRRSSSPIVGNSRDTQLKSQLSSALRMAQSGQYEGAANALFSLARRPELTAERPQIKYILGTMLMELKMYQTAAFQFVDVIRMNHPKYSRQAIEKLSVVADTLGDDTILNYAVSRVDVNDIPQAQKDMIYFRLGEIKLRNREYAKAQDLFNRVGPGSSYYYQALYHKGLAELEANQPAIAVGTFRKMLDARGRAPVTDTNRVEAQLALARALYQKQDWEASIEAYSQIPR